MRNRLTAPFSVTAHTRLHDAAKRGAGMGKTLDNSQG
jgi:hypothetical protein